ncbi:thioesterase II family protein [Streptomyces sp. NPDC058371]|uniref:thioesterase II family protein n=1 Tax=Streptomyces sp. NPDC058371 TaxID=3346463 RepID=UPI00364C287C
MAAVEKVKSYYREGERDAPVRLLAFHHGGGSALSFLPLARRLPAGCEAFLFELNGRSGETDQRPAAHFSEACARFVEDATEVVDRPTIVLGHSLGALFAHNVAGLLPPAQHNFLHTVIVSASRSAVSTAETAPMPKRPFTVRSEDSLLNDLRTFGGIQPELLDDPDFVEIAVDLLGHDLHLADTYVPLPDGPTAIPHQVWYGTDDSTVSPQELARWDESCTAPPLHRGFPGGHFYLYERSEPETALGELVAAAATSTANSSSSA